MSTNLPFVITISRLYGSGGAYLGQRLASRLKFLFLDKELVQQAAKNLQISGKDLDLYDEKLTPAWKFAIEKEYGEYTPPSLKLPPDDRDLFNAERDVILSVAKQQAVVIVGRAGSYILRDRPNHLSILLHASEDFRKKRLQKLYNFSDQEALKVINSVDKERAKYLQAFTGSNWSDVRQYHLCLNTGVIGLEESEEVILKTLHICFGIEIK